MKFYLSSFKVGTEAHKLQELTQNGNRRVVYISNAMDYMSDLDARNRYNADDMAELEMKSGRNITSSHIYYTINKK